MKVAFCSITNPVSLDSRAETSRSIALSENLQLPLIALDIGMKRIGVAVCDRMAISCRGVTYLHRQDQGWPVQLLKLIREYGSKGIVAGLPMNMDGTEGVQAADARAAVKQLALTCSLPVLFQDERLSTWTAKERLYAQGLNEKKVREKIDQTAAAVILEDFLAAHPELKA
ncbi:MAG: Holliday junction resolvase [Zetaproteobacteria bacterium CG1_02_53_45]|nr:MAG: Holliday junction resolvase [Zetaproteobacteria bacterium CG1_02_53_45]